MRRAANIDVNHAEVANAFRGLGCSVEPLHRVGNGCPDLLVGIAGINLLVEVKRDDDGPKHGELSEGQKAWHSAWRGQVCTVRNLEDVGRLVQCARTLREVVGEPA